MKTEEYKQRILPYMRKEDIVDLFRSILAYGRIASVEVNMEGFTFRRYALTDADPLSDDAMSKYQEHTPEQLFDGLRLETICVAEDGRWKSTSFKEAAISLLEAISKTGSHPSAFFVSSKKQIDKDLDEHGDLLYLGVPVVTCSRVGDDCLVLLCKNGEKMSDIRSGLTTGVRK